MVSVVEKDDCIFEITMSAKEWEIVSDVLDREQITMEELLTGFMKWIVANPDAFLQWYEDSKHMLENEHL